MKRKQITFNIGDRVAMSAAWLKSTQAGYDVAQRRGTVIAVDAEMTRITSTQYVYVRWDGDTGPWFDGDGNEKPGRLVCSNNMARVGSCRFADAKADAHA
jgi:hypothetical protein